MSDHREKFIKVITGGLYWSTWSNKEIAEYVLNVIVKYMADNGIKMVHEEPTSGVSRERLSQIDHICTVGLYDDQIHDEIYKIAIQAGAIELGE